MAGGDERFILVLLGNLALFAAHCEMISMLRTRSCASSLIDRESAGWE